MKRFFLILTLLLGTFALVGCNYGGLTSLPEQIAIYQNMGFCKAPLQADITINGATLHINTLEQINEYLASSNIQVQDGLVLYLPSSNADMLDGLIYIYYFKDATRAKAFYNHFKNTFGQNLYLYNDAVIQKGTSELITSSAQNTSYFNKFISGLKNNH